MPQFYKVPPGREHEQGMFIGGGWVPFRNGVAEVPDGGDYTWSLNGFTPTDGPQVPGASAPDAAPDTQTAPSDAPQD